MFALRNTCVALILALTLIGVVVFLTNFPGFQLKMIQVEGNQKVSYSDILHLCSFKLGDNLFRIDTGKFKKQTLCEPRIEYVYVKRKLPCRIVLRVKEKKPCLAINLDHVYGLTHNGEIIPMDENLNLPVISGIEVGKTKLYHKLENERVSLALSLRNLLIAVDKDMLDLISEIDLKQKSDVNLYLVPNGTRISLGWGDFENKLARLSLVLKEEKALDGIDYIDLRFKNQAVVRRFE